MGTDESMQADIARAFENMSDDEAAAWVSAGDYTTVAGLALPEGVPQQFAELLTRDEVVGFGLEADPLGSGQLTQPGGGTQVYLADFFKNCCAGAHYKTVTIDMGSASPPKPK